jgi:hypothetical protein
LEAIAALGRSKKKAVLPKDRPQEKRKKLNPDIS